MIWNFLNKKNSLRSLSDEEFEDVLPRLVEEIVQIDFHTNYSEGELREDWNKLITWEPNSTALNSTSRLGMKLCEHFFPHFYEIKSPKGKSFDSLWNDSVVMEKVFRWNRKSHSTPYLSEIKRGVYFCGGLPKSTMYRPQMAKMITRDSSSVLDPCMGWGGRLLGTVANTAHYTGFDPNTKTVEGLRNMVDFLGIQNRVTIIHDDALNMDNYDIPKVDCVITSPPYFDLEIYSDESTQSITDRSTYNEWEQGFLNPLITKCLDRLAEGGKSCWNVAKVGKHDMWKSVNDAHEQHGFFKNQTHEIRSSARQVNQSDSKTKKSVDKTITFSKNVPTEETSPIDKFLTW